MARQQQQQWEANAMQQQQQQPQGGPRNPYQPMLLPVLPDMQGIPPELRSFRDQCASGVRQAVAMITSMEHQLAWERSRRQQAEEDCKVLLAAVELERSAAGHQLSDMQSAMQQVQARLSGAQLSIPAEELSKANKAATAIQKVYRGNAARKEYEETLRDILRGVDPALDPSLLPAVATSHISNANARPGAGAGARGIAIGGGIERVRHDVAGIKKRMQMLGPDVGQGEAGDATDLQAILSDGYPASSARVVAALSRRCRELQAALVEACEQLEQANLSLEGLREGNAKVLELSQVRIELNEERESRARLQHTIAKLKAIVRAQTAADKSNASDGASRYNPYIAGWYRKAHADQEFDQYPPKGLGSRNGVWLLDGPDAEVEFWDDMRASVPDPILIPKEETAQYQDLLAMQRDMEASARRDFLDPLYSSPVPDTTFFHYNRDTPIMPMLTPQALMREEMPGATFMGLQEQLPSRLRPPAGQYGVEVPHGGVDLSQQSFSFSPAGTARDPVPVQAAQQLEYLQATPMQPMYSPLPLLREDGYMASAPDSHPAFRPPPAGQVVQPVASPPQYPSPPQQYQRPPQDPYYLPQPPQSQQQQQPSPAPSGMQTPRNWTPGYTPPGTPPNFSYPANTPVMVPPGYQQEFRTVQPLIRDQRPPPGAMAQPPLPAGPPPPLPYQQQQQQQQQHQGMQQGLQQQFMQQQQQGANRYGFTPGYTPPGTPPDFDYVHNTAQVPLVMGQRELTVRSNIPEIRDAPGQLTPGSSRRVTFAN